MIDVYAWGTTNGLARAGYSSEVRYVDAGTLL
jgi:hypothetical protein